MKKLYALAIFLPVLFACPPEDGKDAQNANDVPTVVTAPPTPMPPAANANVANPNQPLTPTQKAAIPAPSTSAPKK